MLFASSPSQSIRIATYNRPPPSRCTRNTEPQNLATRFQTPPILQTTSQHPSDRKKSSYRRSDHSLESQSRNLANPSRPMRGDAGTTSLFSASLKTRLQGREGKWLQKRPVTQSKLCFSPSPKSPHMSSSDECATSPRKAAAQGGSPWLPEAAPRLSPWQEKDPGLNSGRAPASQG